MIAAVMCGGLGSRMNSETEKPLLELAGRRFVDIVISALKVSGRFEEVVAIVSPNTPNTREFLVSTGTETIDTPGDGYSRDLSFLLKKLASKKVFVTPADLPLLTSEVVSQIVKLASSHTLAPAISIVMEKSFVEGIGVKPSVVFEKYCHSGITLFNAGRINSGPMDECLVILNRVEIALNANTIEEKELAERLLVQRSQDLA